MTRFDYAKYGLDEAECRARYGRQAAALRRKVAEGKLSLDQRDSSGNKLITLVTMLERAAKA